MLDSVAVREACALTAGVTRPPNDGDRDAWKTYWAAQNMPWRTKPEIPRERQAYLAERRAVTPDLERGIYPFRDERTSIKLNRADIEWLLAIHTSEGMRSPVDWADQGQRNHKGLDFRGADLRKETSRNLPLARTIGGWLLDEAPTAATEQLERAAVHLEGADFRGGFERQTHLEGARLEMAAGWSASGRREPLPRAFGACRAG